MKKIIALNSSVAIFLNEQSGSERLNTVDLEGVLFELASLNTWKQLVYFVDKYAEFILPFGNYLFDLGDSVALKRWCTLPKYPVELRGSLENTLFECDLEDADTVLNAATDDANSNNSQAIKNWGVYCIVDLCVLLKHRDMLRMAILMYSFIIGETPIEKIAKLFVIKQLKNHGWRIEFDWSWLIGNDGFGLGHSLNDNIYETFDISTLVEELLYSYEEGDTRDEGHSYYFFPSESPAPEIYRYGARRIVEMLINSNLNGRFGKLYMPYMDSNLFFTLDKDNYLLPLVWNAFGKMVDDRIKIKICEHCKNPISPRSRRTYCSASCKTQASNQRRDLAFSMAASGTPVEKAIKIVGIKYESAIRRWYQEAESLICPAE